MHAFSREDPRVPEGTREEPRGAESSREEPRGPERSREEPRGPERTGEDRRGPEGTREDGREDPRGRESRRGSSTPSSRSCPSRGTTGPPSSAQARTASTTRARCRWLPSSPSATFFSSTGCCCCTARRGDARSPEITRDRPRVGCCCTAAVATRRPRAGRWRTLSSGRRPPEAATPCGAARPSTPAGGRASRRRRLLFSACLRRDYPRFPEIVPRLGGVFSARVRRGGFGRSRANLEQTSAGSRPARGGDVSPRPRRPVARLAEMTRDDPRRPEIRPPRRPVARPGCIARGRLQCLSA